MNLRKCMLSIFAIVAFASIVVNAKATDHDGQNFNASQCPFQNYQIYSDMNLSVAIVCDTRSGAPALLNLLITSNNNELNYFGSHFYALAAPKDMVNISNLLVSPGSDGHIHVTLDGMGGVVDYDATDILAHLCDVKDGAIQLQCSPGTPVNG